MRAGPEGRRRTMFNLAVRLLKMAALAAFVCAGWCGWMLWKIESFTPAAPLPVYDAGIVLGAALWNDEPSPGLKERLNRALELYEEGRFRYFILTGGYDHAGARLTEAEGMRNYLAACGVPEDRMLLETEARSTYENLAYSRTVMDQAGLSSALIVTHDFHASRAYEIARYLGYAEPGAAAVKSAVLPASQRHGREVLAYTKWKLDSVLLHFGWQIPDTPGLQRMD